MPNLTIPPNVTIPPDVTLPPDVAIPPDVAVPDLTAALRPPGLDPDMHRPVPAVHGRWRDQFAPLAGALDVSVARLIGGAAVLGVAAVLGWRLLAPPPPPADMQLPFADPAVLAADTAPTDTTTAATPEGEVVVHVVGAVAQAGVEHLPQGSRVVDALDAAGGSAPDADLAHLNLAQVLDDGQQVYVARIGEVPPAPEPTPAGATSAAGPSAKVNLNTASAAELDSLPGVGPATAEAIIAAREEHRFGSVDDLLDVRGIGDAKLAELRDRVTV
jgi:competence protein ComEA